MQEIKNYVEVVLNNERQAMLTQIIDDSDSYYEQYTIYPLYEKKTCKNCYCLVSNVKNSRFTFGQS